MVSLIVLYGCTIVIYCYEEGNEERNKDRLVN